MHCPFATAHVLHSWMLSLQFRKTIGVTGKVTHSPNNSTLYTGSPAAYTLYGVVNLIEAEDGSGRRFNVHLDTGHRLFVNLDTMPAL
jgi:hypothetical protein